MKKMLMLTLGIQLFSVQLANAETQPMHPMMKGGMQQTMEDQRESAGIPDKMKVHHLARMRNHLEAIHDIIDALSKDEYDQASQIARNELTMRQGMGQGMGKGQGMGFCKEMTKQEFQALGMGFHDSAEKLADILQKGDRKASLSALSNTLNYCIQCHAAYRQ